MAHQRSRFLHFFLLILALMCASLAAATVRTFLFDGFHPSDLNLSGAATIARTGALCLTTGQPAPEAPGIKGHAFYPTNLQFKTTPAAAETTQSSFSTHFVFQIVSNSGPQTGGHGFAFVVADSTDFSQAHGDRFLGLFNQSSNGNPNNHIFAVEFDTNQQLTFNDINSNHVGVDLNSLISNTSAPAAYYTELGKKEPLVLDSDIPIQAWIEYDDDKKLLNVAIAPLSHPLKPNRSLISCHIDLSPILHEYMYVGFFSGTQKLASKHCILAWSFTMEGEAPELDLSNLPSIPRDHTSVWKSFTLYRCISVALVALLLLTIIVSFCYLTNRKKKLTCEKIEGWEVQYPHRLSYRSLYRATKGFKKELGKGGFGSVYKGVLPRSGMEVAVKKVSHSSQQGMREFVAEVSSLGRMRHRNLVQLHGWCRRGEDLLLVYEFMQKGSLDRSLFDVTGKSLNWEQRFKILKGIASSLLYLHEEWEQVVVHRDVKASNVLLDEELNGKLGDFGLARLYEHGTNPKTTHLVGTLGYMAPELSRTSKSTVSSDVYAYGVLLLEVACGRRPIEPERPCEEVNVVDFVRSLWKGGRILEAMDRRLGNSYVVEEALLVLKLGVLCSQAAPESRPNMRQLSDFLNGDASLQQYLKYQATLQYLCSESVSTSAESTD